MGDRIVQDPAVLSGKPVVRGTRISVAVVIEYLADNPNLDELFADYPRLTMDDVKACLAFAHRMVERAPWTMSALHRAENRLLSSAWSGNPWNSPPEAASREIPAVDLDALWQRVRALSGQTLTTVSGRARFDVTDVDDNRARVVICSSGHSCNVSRGGFERAAAFGLVVYGVTPYDLRKAEIEHPTYTAGIINAILQ